MSEGKFSRNLWGLLCLELWQQQFHDRSAEWSQLSRLNDAGVERTIVAT